MRAFYPVAIVAVVLGVMWPLAMSGQQAASDTYAPPPLLERLMMEDPTFNPTNQYAMAASPAKLRATLETQAASGKLVAQMILGEVYIPAECVFLSFKTAPADCPKDLPPQNFLGITPSFDLAIHWLTLASQQGSGEASEILAQVIERVVRSSTTSHYQMTDVAHYHAIARSQGFDLQDVEITCYTLDQSHPADRLTMEELPAYMPADRPAEFQFTPQQLDALQTAGATGTLTFRLATIQPRLTVLLQHPEGPKVRLRIILTHPASTAMQAPMADRADVVYLQQEDRIVTVPPTYPTLRRKLSFHPPTTEEGAGAAFQQIDGTFEDVCRYPTAP